MEEFDHVHHLQKAYRKLVDCISYPGTINSLKGISDILNLSIPCNNSAMVLALMLLDTEVSFHITGSSFEKVSKYISQLTYSRIVSVEKADYIFVLQELDKFQLDETIKQCKTGDLINPHASATLIVETRGITSENMYVFRGPGIREERFAAIYLDEDNTSWIESRKQKNCEYPLGIDIFFMDQEHNLLALPRTTMVDHAQGHFKKTLF